MERYERRHGHDDGYHQERRRSFDGHGPPREFDGHGPGSPGGPPPGPPPLPPGPPPAWATKAAGEGEKAADGDPRPSSPTPRADRESSSGAPGEWGSAENEADTSLPPVPSDDSRGASPALLPPGPPHGAPPSAAHGSPAGVPKRVLTRPAGHSPGKPTDAAGHFSSAKLPEHLRDLRLAPTSEKKLWTPDGPGSGSNSRNNSVGERRAPVEAAHKGGAARKGGDAVGPESNGKDGKAKGAGPKNKKQGNNKKGDAPKAKAAAAAAPAPPVNPPPPPGPPPPGTAKVAVPQPAANGSAPAKGPKGNKGNKGGNKGGNKEAKEAGDASKQIPVPKGKGAKGKENPTADGDADGKSSPTPPKSKGKGKGKGKVPAAAKVPPAAKVPAAAGEAVPAPQAAENAA